MAHERIELSLPEWIGREVDFERCYTDDDARMQVAIGLARRNVELDSGGPFGAAIFRADGTLIAAGVNRVVPQQCSVAHAEMMAFMSAQKRLQRFRLNEDGERYILATSAQPCSMCYGASIWAGIDELIIGARSEDVMALSEFDEGPLPADWVGELEKRGIRVRRDIQREAACAVFELYRHQSGTRY
ncbi:MAG TPA: nucleoside deaminase [Dokdonella sp.]|nr:nucleoside deaminase [Dokdonella sp.]HET9031815.1 nucleoside deaminase [Dokdonella sp.]